MVGGPYISRGYKISLLTAYINLANSYVARIAKLFTL